VTHGFSHLLKEGPELIKQPLALPIILGVLGLSVAIGQRGPWYEWVLIIGGCVAAGIGAQLIRSNNA
jgi:hypothetical protein